MHNEIKVSEPEYVDENTDFTQIFGGAIFYFLRNNKGSTMIEHAHVVPHAVKFFTEKTKAGTSPVRVLEKSLQGTGPFIPGCSVFSIPIAELFNVKDMNIPDKNFNPNSGEPDLISLFSEPYLKRFADKKYKEEIIEGLYRQKISWLVNNKDDKRMCISRYGFQRIFAQILVGGLEASIQRGQEEILRIPSFINRHPNFLSELPMDYIGEGLKRGTLVVEDEAGDLLGKHSEGGTIVAKKGAGKWTGDVSENVTFYIGGDIDSISQTKNCNWLINGWVRGEINGNDSNFNIAYALVPTERDIFGNLDLSKGYDERNKKKKEGIISELQKNGCTFAEADEGVAKKYKEFVDSLDRSLDSE